MDVIAEFARLIGTAQVLTGRDAAGHGSEWTGKYRCQPRAVLRPADTAEVSAILRLAHETRTPLVPLGGRTGITGAGYAEGRVVLSLERLNRIREIRPAARIAVAEAGVVLSAMHDAAAEHGLAFPVFFGARGSAMIGGILSTNAGGSNVLRYGNTRAQCLGIEAVMADGRVMNLMSALHKDNSGYDLRDLLIGAEGTLGVITAAVLKLVPRPRAHVTAMVAMASLPAALALLNRLQAETGGLVEAFEYMPGNYMALLARHRPDLGLPFAERHEVNILVEIGVSDPRDASPGPDGALPVVSRLEDTLAALMETGELRDAVIARSEAQRMAIWARREVAAEIGFQRQPMVDCDVALPLDRVEAFLTRMAARLADLDPGAAEFTVAHLGDGNVHYTAYPTTNDPERHAEIRDAADALTVELGGSFSAEHGIGLAKLGAMRRLKDPVALDVMRAVKAALDPRGILNPGKVLP